MCQFTTFIRRSLMAELLYILTLFNMLCFISDEIAMNSSDQVLFNLSTFRIASLSVEFMISEILDEFILVVLEGFAIKFITYAAAAAAVN